MSKLNYARNMTERIKGHSVYCAKNRINLGIANRFILAGENKIVEFKNFEDKRDSRLLDSIIIDYEDVVFDVDSSDVKCYRPPYKWSILDPLLVSDVLYIDSKSYLLCFTVDCLLAYNRTTIEFLKEMTNNLDPIYVEDIFLQKIWNSSSMLVSMTHDTEPSHLELSESDAAVSMFKSISEKYDIIVDSGGSNAVSSYSDIVKNVSLSYDDRKTYISIEIKIENANWDMLTNDIMGIVKKKELKK